jgi:hypothetical protein
MERASRPAVPITGDVLYKLDAPSLTSVSAITMIENRSRICRQAASRFLRLERLTLPKSNHPKGWNTDSFAQWRGLLKRALLRLMGRVFLSSFRRLITESQARARAGLWMFTAPSRAWVSLARYGIVSGRSECKCLVSV